MRANGAPPPPSAPVCRTPRTAASLDPTTPPSVAVPDVDTEKPRTRAGATPILRIATSVLAIFAIRVIVSPPVSRGKGLHALQEPQAPATPFRRLSRALRRARRNVVCGGERARAEKQRWHETGHQRLVAKEGLQGWTASARRPRTSRSTRGCRSSRASRGYRASRAGRRGRAAGAQGPPGPVSLTYVSSAVTPLPAGQQVTQDAVCPAGMVVTGGGGFSPSTDLAVTVNSSDGLPYWFIPLKSGAGSGVSGHGVRICPGPLIACRL
jgi:hypothetical protein